MAHLRKNPGPFKQLIFVMALAPTELRLVTTQVLKDTAFLEWMDDSNMPLSTGAPSMALLVIQSTFSGAFGNSSEEFLICQKHTGMIYAVTLEHEM